MNILLINTNPVVSRLLVLCTRDDAVTLSEVSVSEDVPEDVYDIVLVDEASYEQGVADLLLRFERTKKVFISYSNEEMDGFDMTIKKPFLPSQIFEIIQNIESHEEVGEEKEASVAADELTDDDIPTIFPLTGEEDSVSEAQKEQVDDEVLFDTGESVEEEEIEVPVVLDADEVEKIKSLLDMDEQIEVTDDLLSDEEIEVRKIEVIKEQLIAEGLEIVEEEEIVQELSVDLDGTLSKQKKSKKKKSKSKKLKHTEKNMRRIEDAIKVAMSKMTKKQMKKILKGKEIDVRVKLEDYDS